MPKLLMKKPHTHGGFLHAAGDVLQVDEADAAWLINHGVADIHSASSSGNNRKKKSPQELKQEQQHG
ncbi:hypothetical protein AGMMS50256_27580 [Betaproteobacteria bacterium]|nr:hypothetical protein AGMMS50256_27580 [Betaproteobacteria bacterium]